MTFQYHGYFFQRSVASSFADAVHSYFHLTCTIDYSSHRISGGQTQIIVTVSGKNSVVYTIHILHQELNLFTILMWQTVTCGIRNIYHRSSSFDDSLYYSCQIHIVGSPSIFTIKLYILHVFFGMLHRSNCTLQNGILSRIKFMLDVKV